MRQRFTFGWHWLLGALIPFLLQVGTTRAAVQSPLKPPRQFEEIPGLRQIRQSDLKPSLFGSSGVVMDLKLPASSPFTLSRDHVEFLANGKAFIWYGKVDGAPYGTAIFVIDGDVITGHVTRGDGTIYEVRTAEDGSQWILEIDQSQFPEDDAVPIPRTGIPVACRYASADETDTDANSTIDTLVLYTPAARIAAGG